MSIIKVQYWARCWMHLQSQSCMTWALYCQVKRRLNKRVMERSSASDRKTTFACTQKMSYILAHSALLIYNVILQYLSLRIVLFLSCCVFLYFVLWTLHSLCGSVVPGTEGKQGLPTDRGRGAGHSFEAGFNYTYPYRNRPCSKFLREFLDGNFGVGRLRSSKLSSYRIFKALWASTISVEKHSSRTNSHEMRRWSKRKKMYHAWLFDFLECLGGQNDLLKGQNRAIGGFWENSIFPFFHLFSLSPAKSGCFRVFWARFCHQKWSST